MAVDPLPAGTELFVEPPRGGRYRIESSLSSGGFGITYRAVDKWFEHSALSPKVVIKELACEHFVHRAPSSPAIVPNSADTTADHERLVHEFFREARLLLRFRNRHVVQVVDTWSENGTAYYAMLELEGAEALGQTPTPGSAVATRPWPEVERFAAQMLDGLDAIHRGNVLHLDLKPENVLLCADGPLVFIDFGTARRRIQVATAPTRLSGLSMFYAPKEIFDPFFSRTTTASGREVPLPQPHEVGPWSDLYSWAMIVYGMLLPHPTEHPWKRFYGDPDPYATAAADLRQIGVPEGWADTLQQCLKVHAADRRAATGSVLHLRALIRGKPPAQPPEFPGWALALKNAPEIVVCAKGTGAYRTIAEAVAAAPPNTRIAIRPGTYRETLVLEKRLMLEGKTAFGEACRDEVIIDGSDKGCISSSNADVFLHGITLTARGEQTDAVYTGSGLAMDSCRVHCDDTGIFTTDNAYLFNCEFDGGQNGAYLLGDEHIVDSCSFMHTTISAIHMAGGRALIRKTNVNSSKGLSIDPGLCVIHAEDCQFVAPDSFSVPRRTELILRRCQIHGDTRYACGGLLTMEDSTLEYAADRRSLTIGEGSEAVLRNCTVRGAKGPAMVVRGTALVERCDLRGNGSGIRLEPGGRLSATDNIE